MAWVCLRGVHAEQGCECGSICKFQSLGCRLQNHSVVSSMSSQCLFSRNGLVLNIDRVLLETCADLQRATSYPDREGDLLSSLTS